MMTQEDTLQLFPAPTSTQIVSESIALLHGASGRHKGTKWFCLKETTDKTYSVSPQFLASEGFTNYWECDINGWLLRDTDIKGQLEGYSKLRIWWKGGNLQERIGALTNGTNTFAVGDEAEKMWLEDNGFVPNINPENPYFVNNKQNWVALHTPLYFYVALGLFKEKGECDLLWSCPDCEGLVWVDVKVNNNHQNYPNRFIKFASEEDVFSGWLRATNSGKKVMVFHFDKNNTNEWLHITGINLRAEVEDTPVDKRMLNGGSQNNQQFYGGILLSIASSKAVFSYSTMSDWQLQTEVGRGRYEIDDELAPMERAVIIQQLQEGCLQSWQ